MKSTPFTDTWSWEADVGVGGVMHIIKLEVTISASNITTLFPSSRRHLGTVSIGDTGKSPEMARVVFPDVGPDEADMDISESSR
jgi:hypothetical protein